MVWRPSPRPPIRMRVLIGEEEEEKVWEVGLGGLEDGEEGRCSNAVRVPGMEEW